MKLEVAAQEVVLGRKRSGNNNDDEHSCHDDDDNKNKKTWKITIELLNLYSFWDPSSFSNTLLNWSSSENQTFFPNKKAFNGHYQIWNLKRRGQDYQRCWK